MVKKKFRRAVVIGNPIDVAKGENVKGSEQNIIENEAIIIVLATAADRTLKDESQTDEVKELAKKLNEVLPAHITSYKNKLNNKRQTSLMYNLHQRVTELVSKIPVGADDALIMVGLVSTLLDNDDNFVSSILDKQTELHIKAIDLLEVKYRENENSSKYRLETTISQDFSKCKTTSDSTKAKKLLSTTKNKVIQKAKVLHLVNLSEDLGDSVYAEVIKKLKSSYEEDIEEYSSEASNSISNVTSYINDIGKTTRNKDLFISAIISKLDYEVKIPAAKFLVEEAKKIKLDLDLNDEIAIEKIKSKLNKCREYTVQCKPFLNH